MKQRTERSQESKLICRRATELIGEEKCGQERGVRWAPDISWRGQGNGRMENWILNI